MNIEELRAIARAATPGEWEHTHIFDGEEIISTGPHGVVCVMDCYHDAKHIATFHPSRVLALLDALREARGALEYYDNVHNKHWAVNLNHLGGPATNALAALHKIEERMG